MREVPATGEVSAEAALLAFETVARSASACVLDGHGRELGFSDLGGGEAETGLVPLLGRLIAAHGVPRALAVAAGPGSFTGLRIGLSAARALSWCDALPVHGVDALVARAVEAGPGLWLVAVPLKRDTTFRALVEVALVEPMAAVTESAATVPAVVNESSATGSQSATAGNQSTAAVPEDRAAAPESTTAGTSAVSRGTAEFMTSAGAVTVTAEASPRYTVRIWSATEAVLDAAVSPWPAEAAERLAHAGARVVAIGPALQAKPGLVESWCPGIACGSAAGLTARGVARAALLFPALFPAQSWSTLLPRYHQEPAPVLQRRAQG